MFYIYPEVDVKSNMKEETRAEKISRLQGEIAAAQSELACLVLGDPRVSVSMFPRLESAGVRGAKVVAHEQLTKIGDLSVSVAMEPYCPKCFGPCLRRPRHGEFNI